MSIWGTGIVKGMFITMKNMFRGPITVKYPHERVELPERARWAVQLKLDEEGQHKCTACLACQKACPDFIIDIDVETDAERNKCIRAWNYELGACMMCGLCVEACPFDAIKMGHDYELATTSTDDLHQKLIVDSPAAKPKRKERPAGERPAREDAKPSAEKPAAGESAAPAADKPVAAATKLPDEKSAEAVVAPEGSPEARPEPVDPAPLVASEGEVNEG